MKSYSEYFERINEIITEAKKIIEYYKSLNDEWITREIEKVEERLNIQIKDEKEFSKHLYIPQGYKSVKEYLEAHKNDDPHVVLEEIKKALEGASNYCFKLWSYFYEDLPNQIDLINLPYNLSVKDFVFYIHLGALKEEGEKEKAERLEKAVDEIMPAIDNLREKINNYLNEVTENGLCGRAGMSKLLNELSLHFLDQPELEELLAGDHVPIIGDKIDEKAFKDESSIRKYYYYMMWIFSDRLEKTIEAYKDEIDRQPPQISMRDIIAYLFELRNKAREKWMIVYDYYVKTGLLKKVEDEIRAELERRKRVREEVQKELINELEKIFVSS
ncbi:hypothetical protein STSV1pORF35 [Sulfolobus virus STSV1]|uniref:hypothetical protein n=1 Tax=Sulfolobus virus STSV1 TaxID=285013 RepID=UPI000042B111|nr:hypothetical protein STSV1pORF35 [Sulfolobus virus STSV1]CAH04218.1 hypothetical protein [Sulfolobus virus STSV1]